MPPSNDEHVKFKASAPNSITWADEGTWVSSLFLYESMYIYICECFRPYQNLCERCPLQFASLAYHKISIVCVGGLGFEFCMFVVGWRHALRSEWPFVSIIITNSIAAAQSIRGGKKVGEQPRHEPGVACGPAAAWMALVLRVAACLAACPCRAWESWLPRRPLQLQHRLSAWPVAHGGPSLNTSPSVACTDFIRGISCRSAAAILRSKDSDVVEERLPRARFAGHGMTERPFIIIIE